MLENPRVVQFESGVARNMLGEKAIVVNIAVQCDDIETLADLDPGYPGDRDVIDTVLPKVLDAAKAFQAEQGEVLSTNAADHNAVAGVGIPAGLADLIGLPTFDPDADNDDDWPF